MAWFYHTYHTCHLLSTILMYYVLPLTAIYSLQGYLTAAQRKGPLFEATVHGSSPPHPYLSSALTLTTNPHLIPI